MQSAWRCTCDADGQRQAIGCALDLGLAHGDGAVVRFVEPGDEATKPDGARASDDAQRPVGMIPGARAAGLARQYVFAQERTQQALPRRKPRAELLRGQAARGRRT
jgi:hypothetical protein